MPKDKTMGAEMTKEQKKKIFYQDMEKAMKGKTSALERIAFMVNMLSLAPVIGDLGEVIQEIAEDYHMVQNREAALPIEGDVKPVDLNTYYNWQEMDLSFVSNTEIYNEIRADIKNYMRTAMNIPLWVSERRKDVIYDDLSNGIYQLIKEADGLVKGEQTVRKSQKKTAEKREAGAFMQFRADLTALLNVIKKGNLPENRAELIKMIPVVQKNCETYLQLTEHENNREIRAKKRPVTKLMDTFAKNLPMLMEPDEEELKADEENLKNVQKEYLQEIRGNASIAAELKASESISAMKKVLQLDGVNVDDAQKLIDEACADMTKAEPSYEKMERLIDRSREIWSRQNVRSGALKAIGVENPEKLTVKEVRGYFAAPENQKKLNAYLCDMQELAAALDPETFHPALSALEKLRVLEGRGRSVAFERSNAALMRGLADEKRWREKKQAYEAGDRSLNAAEMAALRASLEVQREIIAERGGLSDQLKTQSESLENLSSETYNLLTETPENRYRDYRKAAEGLKLEDVMGDSFQLRMSKLLKETVAEAVGSADAKVKNAHRKKEIRLTDVDDLKKIFSQAQRINTVGCLIEAYMYHRGVDWRSVQDDSELRSRYAREFERFVIDNSFEKGDNEAQYAQKIAEFAKFYQSYLRMISEWEIPDIDVDDPIQRAANNTENSALALFLIDCSQSMQDFDQLTAFRAAFAPEGETDKEKLEKGTAALENAENKLTLIQTLVGFVKLDEPTAGATKLQGLAAAKQFGKEVAGMKVSEIDSAFDGRDNYMNASYVLGTAMAAAHMADFETYLSTEEFDVDEEEKKACEMMQTSDADIRVLKKIHETLRTLKSQKMSRQEVGKEAAEEPKTELRKAEEAKTEQEAVEEPKTEQKKVKELKTESEEATEELQYEQSPERGNLYDEPISDEELNRLDALLQAEEDQTPEEQTYNEQQVQTERMAALLQARDEQAEDEYYTDYQNYIKKAGAGNINSNNIEDLWRIYDDPNTDEKLKRYLVHRIGKLQKIEELESNAVPGKPGQPTDDGDGIILSDAYQTETQTTNNGCWSVSLATLLNYRGVNIDQKTIRGFRPEAQYFKKDLNMANADTENALENYVELIQKVLPNTALNTVDVARNRSRDASKDALIKSIERGLRKDNSPVSVLCGNGGHYLTVVGMENGNLYILNPLSDIPVTVSIDDFIDSCNVAAFEPLTKNTKAAGEKAEGDFTPEELAFINEQEPVYQFKVQWLQDITLDNDGKVSGSLAGSGASYNEKGELGGVAPFINEGKVKVFRTADLGVKIEDENVHVTTYLPVKYKNPALQKNAAQAEAAEEPVQRQAERSAAEPVQRQAERSAAPAEVSAPKEVITPQKTSAKAPAQKQEKKISSEKVIETKNQAAAISTSPVQKKSEKDLGNEDEKEILKEWTVLAPSLKEVLADVYNGEKQFVKPERRLRELTDVEATFGPLAKANVGDQLPIGNLQEYVWTIDRFGRNGKIMQKLQKLGIKKIEKELEKTNSKKVDHKKLLLREIYRHVQSIQDNFSKKIDRLTNEDKKLPRLEVGEMRTLLHLCSQYFNVVGGYKNNEENKTVRYIVGVARMANAFNNAPFMTEGSRYENETIVETMQGGVARAFKELDRVKKRFILGNSEAFDAFYESLRQAEEAMRDNQFKREQIQELQESAQKYIESREDIKGTDKGQLRLDIAKDVYRLCMSVTLQSCDKKIKKEAEKERKKETKKAMRREMKYNELRKKLEGKEPVTKNVSSNTKKTNNEKKLH